MYFLTQENQTVNVHDNFFVFMMKWENHINQIILTGER